MSNDMSVKEQVAAMESWAIDVKNSLSSENYTEGLGLLRNINSQGRKLEWRYCPRGIKNYPKLKEVEILKTKISQTRAAAQATLTNLKHLEKVDKRKQKKTDAELAAIEKEKKKYQKEITKSVAILIKVLLDVSSITNAEPWFDPVILVKPENKSVLATVLIDRVVGGSAFYHLVPPKKTKSIISQLDLKSVDLEKQIISGAVLEGKDLTGANLKSATLNKVYFRRANLLGAKLTSARMKEAIFIEASLIQSDMRKVSAFKAVFIGANLSGADLRGGNFKECNFSNANFLEVKMKGANIEGADFHGAKNLNVIQIRSAKNYHKAINLPANIL